MIQLSQYDFYYLPCSTIFISGPLQGELQGHLTSWNAAIQTNQLIIIVLDFSSDFYYPVLSFHDVSILVRWPNFIS